MLGSSESIGGFTNLFQPLNNRWKIFRRREVPQPFSQQVTFPSGLPKEVDIAGTAPPIPAGRKIRIGQIAEKMVLDLFSPTRGDSGGGRGMKDNDEKTGRPVRSAAGSLKHKDLASSAGGKTTPPHIREAVPRPEEIAVG